MASTHMIDEGTRLFTLGRSLLFGEGVERDRRRAQYVLEQATLFGNAEGMYLLVCMLTRGHGGPKDEKRAKELLDMAGKKGYPLSRESAALEEQEPAFACLDDQAGTRGKG